MNFALSLTSLTSPTAALRRDPGGNSDAPRSLQGRAVTAPSVTSDALVASVLAGELSESTAGTIAKATTQPQALALVLGSPEFQRR
jgi:uncharacterized protein (DUF1800 family)